MAKRGSFSHWSWPGPFSDVSKIRRSMSPNLAHARPTRTVPQPTSAVRTDTAVPLRMERPAAIQSPPEVQVHRLTVHRTTHPSVATPVPPRTLRLGFSKWQQGAAEMATWLAPEAALTAPEQVGEVALAAPVEVMAVLTLLLAGPVAAAGRAASSLRAVRPEAAEPMAWVARRDWVEATVRVV